MMALHWALVSSLLMTWTGPGTGAAAGGARAELFPKLEVSVVRKGDAATRLRIAVVNESDQVFWVNKRFLSNSGAAPADAREILVEVRSVEGLPVLSDCKTNAGAAGRNDYVLLYPGDFVGRLVEFDCMQMLRGRRYVVTVRYKDSNRPPGLKPPGRVLGVELRSGPVEFEF
jgi:hypothetical protein